MNKPTDNMDDRAKTGVFTTLISFITGNVLHLDKTAQDEVIFILQVAAFLISIIVGVLTACYYVRKLRTKNTE